MSAEVEMFVTLTVLTPPAMGFGTASRTEVLTVEPHVTRADLYRYMRDRLPAEVRDGNVLYFSAEPNRIGGAR